MLETKRLILRNFQESDLDDLFELTSNKKICSMSGLIFLQDKPSVKILLNRFLTKPTLFAIVLKQTNKVVGLVEIMDHDKDFYRGIEISSGAKEIAFLLNESYWQQGIMTEVLTKILDYAFNTLNIPQILSGNFVENIPSAKLQEKLGLKVVGEINHFKILENKHTTFVQRTINKEDYDKLLTKQGRF